MLSAIFKHRLGALTFFSFLSNGPMSSSFFGQELHRALREQGPAIHSFKVISAGPLQAVARIKILEGHTLEVLLTQQGYKVDSKPNEGMTQVFETIEDLLHAISPLYVQKRSETLLEALKRLS